MLTDHLGSVHALADETGNIVESYRYDAWGRVLGVYDGSNNPLTQSAVGNRYLWQGREYSFKTTFYFFRSRFYDSITGRWLSNDRIGISGGLNQYMAFNDNPVNFRDPFGLDVWVINDPNSAMGLGHVGAIIGGNGFYTYHSFGPEKPGDPNGPGQYTWKTFSTLEAAMQYAKEHGYQNYKRYFSTCDGDKNARQKAQTYRGTDYNVISHNCLDMVNAVMDSAGVTTWVPGGGPSPANSPNCVFKISNTAEDEGGKIDSLLPKQ